MKKITLLLAVVLIAIGLGLAYVDAAVAPDGYDSPGVDETLPKMSRRKRPPVVPAAQRPVASRNSSIAVLRQRDGRRIVPSIAMLTRRSEVLQKRQNDYLEAHPRISDKLRACVKDGGQLIGRRLFHELCGHRALMENLQSGVFSSGEELTHEQALRFFNLRKAGLYWEAGTKTHFLLGLPCLERLALHQVDNDVFPVVLPKNLEALDLIFFNLGQVLRDGIEFPSWSSIPATPIKSSALPALKNLRLTHCVGLAFFFDRLPRSLEELQVVDCDELFATGPARKAFWRCVRTSSIKKLRLFQHDYPAGAIERLVATKSYNAKGERIEMVWSSD